jgi:hypothetical protein
MRKRDGMRRRLLVSDVIGGYAAPGLVVTSWSGLGFFGVVRLEFRSPVLSVSSHCAARVPGPIEHKP